MLRLVQEHGTILYESPIVVRMQVTTLDIHLPERQKAGSAKPISSQRLSHRVPREASKLFAKAVQARERDDFAGAKRLLEEALRVDPEFCEAHVNLGAIHARNKDYEAAAQEFEAATKADPACAVAHSNLAFAYLHLRRPADAERAARQALRLDPGNATTTGLLNQSQGMKRSLARMALTFTEM